MEKLLEVLKAKGLNLDENGLAEVQAAYEEEVAGLKNKNRELIERQKRLRAGVQDENPSKLFDLEDALSASKAEAEALKARYERELKRAQAQASELTAKLEAEAGTRRALIKDRALSDALGANKITDPVLSKAARAMLASQVDVIDDGGQTKVVYKSEKGAVDLQEYLTAWAQGDEGKRFVSAPVNSGSGAAGGSKGSAKVITRAEFDKLGEPDRVAFFKDGGKLTD